jgi:hypothetical protein
MNIKRHRVVSNGSPFPGATHALQDRAVQCAENEGWPIPDEPTEPSRVVAQATFVQRVTARVSQPVRNEVHFQPGHPVQHKRAAPPVRRVVMQWQGGMQAARP